jgi:hypothetical protein
VSLYVYATQQDGKVIAQQILAGTRHTIALGQHLHLVAVTAVAISSNSLQPEQLYAYDLAFETDSGDFYLLQQSLDCSRSPSVSVSYFKHGLPTLILPPRQIDSLKIIHGSCRKTHGGGIDALPIVDDLLEHSAHLVQQRPQQLFFTGDQIYGDDVADPWLFALSDASDALLGWDELLPTGTDGLLIAKHLPPGERTHAAENLAGFTAGLQNQPDRVNSHLLSFGEYCTAYLYAWSPVLWSNQFPRGSERYREHQRANIWDREVATLQNFYRPLWKVRRALANIATYMIFDDHDVSDDWYLNQAWCERVLSKPLGRRVVQNAMLAYALCQAWGNTPEQFEPGSSGEQLLQAAQAWATSGGSDLNCSATIAQLLGLPPDPSTSKPQDYQDQFCQDQQVQVLNRAADSLRWHYTIRSDCHEVIVLDTRTWRGYPIAANNSDDSSDSPGNNSHLAPPMLLSPTAFEQQIRLPLQQSQNLQTLVIAPTNLIHLHLIDWAQQWSLAEGKVFQNDVGDAWNLHKQALSELLAVLFAARDRVIVLSGDIHYGFAARLSYWRQSAQPAQVLVQLTSSAFKNAELKTQIVQTKLKSIVPELPQEWVGWNQSPQLWEVQALPNQIRWLKLPPVKAPLIRRLKPIQGNRELVWTVVAQDAQSLPDWQYRIEWIKRQPAQTLAWSNSLDWLLGGQSGGQSVVPTWLSWLWRNRWMQEGNEVVGASNLGLVWFRGFDQSTTYPTVIQDLYWSPPWQPNSLVVSRFEAELRPEEAATPFPVLPLKQ